jgi:hypothetical protein
LKRGAIREIKTTVLSSALIISIILIIYREVVGRAVICLTVKIAGHDACSDPIAPGACCVATVATLTARETTAG